MDFTISGSTLCWLVIIAIVITTLIGWLIKKNISSRKISPQSSTKKAWSLADRTTYPEKQIFKYSGTLFKMGLIIVMGLATLAFNWTVYTANEHQGDNSVYETDEIEIVPRTDLPPPEAPKPPPPKMEVIVEEEITDEEPEFIDMSIDADSEVIAPIQESTPTPPPPPPPPPMEEVDVDEIISFAEEMPRFPGCDDLPTFDEMKLCSDKALITYLSKNMRYPSLAQENGIEGTCFIQFVVEKDGSITDIKLLRDIGGGCGREAVRVVKKMSENAGKWTPGKQGGRPVRVRFNLPVKFKLH